MTSAMLPLRRSRDLQEQNEKAAFGGFLHGEREDTMLFSKDFIAATERYSTYSDHVAAPYLRRSFTVERELHSAEITICGLGFYRLFINGKEITKGLLAPYVSNPDDLLYYDRYDIAELLTEGKNAVGILLGNGILNSVGGGVWAFDKAAFRSAPKVALAMELEYEGGKEVITADPAFKVHPSPILFDDFRCGEIYDARNEIFGWNLPEFDDCDWQNAIPAETPKGEPRLCTAENIVSLKKLRPVSVRKGRVADNMGDERLKKSARWNMIPMDAADKEGWLYDFGENLAGLVHLKIKGAPGQRISIQTGELLTRKGELNMVGMRFQPEGLDHRMIYTCKGEGYEEYAASFTYFGMRYCLVSGITEEQATEDLLTFEVMTSDLKTLEEFSCSDEVVNRLQRASYNANISNFYYIPTDCPHREKNGWTGDAALSAEQFMLRLSAENSLRVWLENIRKAQRPSGELPGIVPTSGWGFSVEEGTNYNGPAWDCALAHLPYYIWIYRGDTEVIRENAEALYRYLRYIADKRDERGLIEVGLYDYLPIKYRHEKTPLVTSDTLITMDTCRKCMQMFEAIGFDEGRAFAENLRKELRVAARKELLGGVTVYGENQSAQAMGLAYGLFEPEEREAAFAVLLQRIHESDDHLDTGILGGRVIFHVLAEFGYVELAYYMITRPDYPSYGHWVLEEDCTALFESFKAPGEEIRPGSKNHHFYGDITSWFFKYLAGVQINPYGRDYCELTVKPHFIPQLTHAEGWHDHPKGRIAAAWKRIGEQIELTVTVPAGCYGSLRLPDGEQPLVAGITTYYI